MTPEQREELRAAALAASPGPWKGDRYDGTVKYELLDANDNAVIKGDNGNSGDGGYGITNYEDEVYLKAANPSAILSLIAQVEAYQADAELNAACTSAFQSGSLDEKALNALLWFYRRAENAYGRLPFAEEAITGLRARIVAAPTIPAIPGTKEDAT